MSGKAGHSGTGEHGNPIGEGVGTALSWMTIIPARGATTFDRITGARAMAAIPLAGLALGVITALPAAVLLRGGVSALLVAALTVTGWELGSRMMHIDGLADVGDALGSYAPPERAQEILADKYSGALGMGSVFLTLLVQTAALVAIYTSSGIYGAAACALIPALARAAGLIGCHRHFSPFSTTGFGGLIIGTVRTWWIVAWFLVLIAVGSGALWGVAKPMATALAVCLPVAALVAVLSAWQLVRHCNRRFGGLNGDCIGASIEVATAAAAAALALGV